MLRFLVLICPSDDVLPDAPLTGGRCQGAIPGSKEQATSEALKAAALWALGALLLVVTHVDSELCSMFLFLLHWLVTASVVETVCFQLLA